MKNFYKTLILITSLIFLTSCGDADKKTEKVTKGHREAIKYQCADASDVKACGLEVRRNFTEDGNEFENLGELDKGQVNKIKTECMRAKSFGLESYNDCLIDLRARAEDGSLWDKDNRDGIIPDKGGDHIENLRAKTVVVEILIKGNNKQLIKVGNGSGVIVKKDLIATNCHVTDALAEYKKNYTASLFIKELNKKKYAKVTVYKEAPEHDICIVKKMKDIEFSFPNKPVKKIVEFKKLKQGNFVRTFGSPTGDKAEEDFGTYFEGHTSEGSINYLGTVGETKWSWNEGITPDTKLIVHSAAINFGNSGGPLFNKDGYLIGINTTGDESGKFNIAVSADHITELLKE